MDLGPKFPEELRERYEPVDTIGMGGMGMIVLARDRQLDREVVVKLTLAPWDQRARQRAMREAYALAKLRHPNVIEVFAAGETEDGPYLVMEKMDGGSLDDRAEEVDLVEVFRQAAAGLDAVHEAGLLHRDMKPGNILIAADGRVVLADFGLVRDPEVSRMTESGQVVGTMVFMAPEMLAGEAAGPPADWYGWGASLFTCLEGRHPYEPEELVRHVATGHPLIPRYEKTPPGLLRAAIEATLVSDPRKRVRPSRLLRDDGGPPPTATAMQDAVDPMAPSKIQGDSEGKRRRSWLPGLMLAGGITLGLFAGRLIDPPAPPNPTTPTAPPTRSPAPSEPGTRAALESAREELLAQLSGGDWSRLGVPDTDELRRVYPQLITLRFDAVYEHFLDAALAWIRDHEREPDPAELERLVYLPAAKVARYLEELSLRLRTGEARFHLTVQIQSGRAPDPFLKDWDHESVSQRIAAVGQLVHAFVCRLETLPLETSPWLTRLAAELAFAWEFTTPEARDAPPPCRAAPPRRVVRFLDILHEELRQAQTVAAARPWFLAEQRVFGRIQDEGHLDFERRLRHLGEIQEIGAALEGTDPAWLTTFHGLLLSQYIRTAYVHPESPREEVVKRSQRLAARFMGTAPVAPEEARFPIQSIDRLRTGYVFIEVKEMQPIFEELDALVKAVPALR